MELTEYVDELKHELADLQRDYDKVVSLLKRIERKDWQIDERERGHFWCFYCGKWSIAEDMIDHADDCLLEELWALRDSDWGL